MRGEAVLPAPIWRKQSLCFALYEVLYCHGVSTHRLQQLQSGVISYSERLHKSLRVTDKPNSTLSVAIMPTVVRHDGHLVEFLLLSSVLS